MRFLILIIDVIGIIDSMDCIDSVDNIDKTNNVISLLIFNNRFSSLPVFRKVRCFR